MTQISSNDKTDLTSSMLVTDVEDHTCWWHVTDIRTINFLNLSRFGNLNILMDFIMKSNSILFLIRLMFYHECSIPIYFRTSKGKNELIQVRDHKYTWKWAKLNPSEPLFLIWDGDTFNCALKLSTRDQNDRFRDEIRDIWYFSWSFWTNSILVFLKDKPIVALAWAISVWVSDWSIHLTDAIGWERHLLATNLKTIISFEIVLLTEFIFF